MPKGKPTKVEVIIAKLRGAEVLLEVSPRKPDSSKNPLKIR